jgi:Tetracyclin repressor-like, C-terminal domain
MVRRQREIGPDVLHGLMAEAYDLDPDVFGIMTGVMTAILERAAERGEIGSADLGERVVTVPVDLLRHEMLLGRHPVSDRTVREIVDDVFLPLVHAKFAP